MSEIQLVSRHRHCNNATTPVQNLTYDGEEKVESDVGKLATVGEIMEYKTVRKGVF